MSGLPSPIDGSRRLPLRPTRPRRLDDVTSPTATSSSAGRAGARPTWARRYRDLLWVTDTAIIVVAVLLAVAVRLAVLGSTAVAAETSFERIGVPLLIMLAWVAALAAFRTRDSHVLGTGATEYRRVANATATAFGLLAIVLLVVDAPSARWYFVVAIPLGGGALLVGRWLWRKWLAVARRSGRFLARAIVVGSPADVRYVLGQIERNTSAGFDVVGAAVAQPERVRLETPKGRAIPVVSDLGGAARAAVLHQVDAVIVTGSLGEDGDAVRQLGWDLEGTGAQLVLSSRLTDVAGPRIHFRPVDGLPLIHVEIPQFDGVKHAMKRGFDIAAAGFGLLLIAPLLAAIAVAIKLDGPGRVLYAQERVGRDGQVFKLLKFRSMIPDADRVRAELAELNEGNGLLFKMKDDPRVTRVGRFLRKHSLDELPQLWNVLRGEMSMVGPRPPLAEEVNGYESHVHRRLLIKPGLTGLWQVSGRSDLDWEESVRLDLYYVENWSLTGDLMLIWRTVRVVVSPVGAY